MMFLSVDVNGFPKLADLDINAPVNWALVEVPPGLETEESILMGYAPGVANRTKKAAQSSIARNREPSSQWTKPACSTLFTAFYPICGRQRFWQRQGWGLD